MPTPTLVRVGDELTAADRRNRHPDLAARSTASRSRQELIRTRNRLAAAEQARARAEELGRHNQALADERDRLATQHQAVLASTSWRITAPLRSLRHLFKLG